MRSGDEIDEAPHARAPDLVSLQIEEDTHQQTMQDPENPDTSAADKDFHWTALTIVQAIAVFCLAGVAEISGGWLVWQAIRGNANGRRPWWYAVFGSMVLVAYGFIPTLQPTDTFGRVYAVYGGFFIVLSFLFGWGLDGDKPDLGDVVGGVIALVGVLVVLFWPR